MMLMLQQLDKHLFKKLKGGVGVREERGCVSLTLLHKETHSLQHPWRHCVIVLISERGVYPYYRHIEPAGPNECSHQVSSQQVQRVSGSSSKSFMALTQTDRQTDRHFSVFI